LQVAEWTKAISVKWRELTVEQKETFQKMAATDKQRYVQQVNPLNCSRASLLYDFLVRISRDLYETILVGKF